MTVRSSTATASSLGRIETYAREGDRLVRRIKRRNDTLSVTDVGLAPKHAVDDRLHEVADKHWLRLREPPELPATNPLQFADLFCGCGALSLGVQEAARALGRRATPVLSVDDDEAPLSVYEKSVVGGDKAVRQVDIAAVLPGGFGARETEAERAFLHGCPQGLDLVLAGPPCQGHSSLNNYTRHDDDRNDLYLRVVRFVELRRPRYCLIENVGTVLRDHRASVSRAKTQLRALGYTVDDQVIRLDVLGVPQTRRRHIVVAAARGAAPIDVNNVVEEYAVPRGSSRSVAWAIRDLRSVRASSDFDSASVPLQRNLDRMKWLIANDAFDLPNPRRPKCHCDPKTDSEGNTIEHSYKAMYGRLDWNKPAQTITSGYGSMGQGRYVHPDIARTLTPHEAARLQLLPDWLNFQVVAGRGRWARMIGNVAPMKLSYVFALEMFR